ncbi:MAG: extracellular solute-binding protein [Clostridia bacterium]|nr:extracellular solute-binding protein [Clostridiales bacterium]MDO4829182.1 extracellular solute-binding protein [Clostridia bacterium]MDY2768672.1 extracellular solute-binding protein [Eubacteriales bacterium]
MKKLLAILVALTLALAGISAVAEEEKVTLSFLRIGNDEAERAFWQWAIEAFEKENADVRIAYEEAPIGESMDTVLNTRFASGEGVDLIGHGILSVAQRVEANQYMAIDEYFDSWEGKDDIMPSVLANGTYNGHVYGLGYSVTPYVFAYRSDLLEEAGIAVPTTWDELADAARELTKKNESGEVEFAGFCYPQTGGNLVELDVFVYGNGGQYIVDGEPVFADNEAVAGALSFLRELIPDVSLTYSSSEVNPFVSGSAAMTLINNAALTTMLKNPEYEGKVGIALPPNNGVKASFCGCNMLFIGTKCQNPDAAFRFISFVLSKEATLKRAEMVKIPVTRTSLVEAYAAMDPMNLARSECVTYGTGMPRVTWSTGFQAVRNELSQNVVFGDMDIAEALNKAQTDIEFRING